VDYTDRFFSRKTGRAPKVAYILGDDRSGVNGRFLMVLKHVRKTI